MFPQCVSDFTVSYGLPVSLFLAGLVGGFSHCAVMCGPFVIAQQKESCSINRLSSFLLLPYHIGRMTTYIVLAILLNSVINMAFLFSDARIILTAPLLITAGIIFLVTAFPSLGRVFPWAMGLQVTKTFGVVTKLTSKLINNPSAIHRYALGVLLGFMPCGMVLSALMAAASTSHPLYAGVSMGAFSLGTMPALIAVGIFGSAVRHKNPLLFSRLSQGALVFSSIWLFALAGTMIF